MQIISNRWIWETHHSSFAYVNIFQYDLRLRLFTGARIISFDSFFIQSAETAANLKWIIAAINYPKSARDSEGPRIILHYEALRSFDQEQAGSHSEAFVHPGKTLPTQNKYI